MHQIYTIDKYAKLIKFMNKYNDYTNNAKEVRFLNVNSNVHILLGKINLSKILKNKKYYPKTCVENQSVDFYSPIYYIKQDGCDNGDGIIIASNLLNTRVPKNCIVQEEIYPHLLNGYKFTVRINVLIDASKNIYISKDGEIKLCSSLYTSSLDKKSNLTNTNKTNKDPLYVKNINIVKDNFFDIISIIIDSLFEIYKYTVFDDMNCYHILGYDFILDSNNKWKILEINAHSGFCVVYDIVDTKYSCTVGRDIVSLCEIVLSDKINHSDVSIHCLR